MKIGTLIKYEYKLNNDIGQTASRETLPKISSWPWNIQRFLPYRHFNFCNPISVKNEIPSWNFVKLYKMH